MFSTIFDRTDMKINPYGIVFRVEFDGGVRFFLAAPKSMFLLISIDFFRCFLQFFRFRSFRKNLDFFFRAAAEPKSCRQSRGSRRGRRRGGRRRRGGSGGDFTS